MYIYCWETLCAKTNWDQDILRVNMVLFKKIIKRTTINEIKCSPKLKWNIGCWIWLPYKKVFIEDKWKDWIIEKEENKDEDGKCDQGKEKKDKFKNKLGACRA